MFVGQKVFCRTESIFKLDTVAEIHKDTVRLLDGTTVCNDSVIPTISSKMCELSNYKKSPNKTMVEPGILIEHENDVIQVIKQNNSIIATFVNVKDTYHSYAVDLARKKLFAFNNIKNRFTVMTFNSQKKTHHELNYEILNNWSVIYKTPYILYWSTSRSSVLNTEDETISPLIKQTENH